MQRSHNRCSACDRRSWQEYHKRTSGIRRKAITPERLRQIEELYHSAREREPSQRSAFLIEACRGDEDLRSEVESLLAQDASALGGPVDQFAWEALAGAVDDSTVTGLALGTQLGPYQILGSLGAGGMGRVYKARDSRLQREVAIKVVFERFGGRFQREARAIAALNHPYICTLYDVGPNYLVMELVEGDTLAACLKKGPVAMDRLLRYGTQTAEALKAAHAKGIIHRDLKPGNVMLTKNGVKVLDFGLAKSQQDRTMTATNAIMGTPAYMAPEQMQGEEADARTDIYALGLVLYEMATGTRAAAGQMPPMEKLPPRLGHIVERCLAPDPDDRWQTAADVGRELEWAGQETSERLRQVPPEVRRHRLSLAWSVAAVALLLGFLGTLLVHLRQVPSAPAATMRFQVPPPPNAPFNTQMGLSPDGRLLAFIPGIESTIWVRPLDSLEARPLAGTQNNNLQPFFWSPDSRFIAYGAAGKLMKVEASGGPPQALTDAPNGVAGGTWNREGVILFGQNGGGLMRVSDTGGVASPVTTPDPSRQETSHQLPQFLPDGRHFIYWNTTGSMFAGSLDSKPPEGRLLLTSPAGAVYAPSPDSTRGHLLFMREQTLLAQAFDPDRLVLSGEPVPIAQDVASFLGHGFFTASSNGALAYTSGSAQGNLQLTWIDRSGKELGTVGMPGLLYRPVVSPDGKIVVVDRRDPQTGLFDLWLYNLARGTASRFTFNSQNNQFPVWSPDGSHIAFTSSRDAASGFNLYQKAVGGNSTDEPLDRSQTQRIKIPLDWSRDGRYIFETVVDPKTSRDVWVLPLFGDRKRFPYLQTVFEERNATLSPNSFWLAYSSDETNRDEIYVQTFPQPGGKWQVSTNGGRLPRWSRDGKELFFIGADRKLMVVQVKSDLGREGASFEVGVPQPLFDTRLGYNEGLWYDVSDDGRFLLPVPVEHAADGLVTVVLNWQAGLKK